MSEGVGYDTILRRVKAKPIREAKLMPPKPAIAATTGVLSEVLSLLTTLCLLAIVFWREVIDSLSEAIVSTSTCLVSTATVTTGCLLGCSRSFFSASKDAISTRRLRLSTSA